MSSRRLTEWTCDGCRTDYTTTEDDYPDDWCEIGGDDLCEECWSYCNECSTAFHNGDLTEHDGDRLCEDCLDALEPKEPCSNCHATDWRVMRMGQCNRCPTPPRVGEW